jgi:hypothetical protein
MKTTDFPAENEGDSDASDVVTPDENGSVTSIRALARAVDRSHAAVVKWLKHEQWPAEVSRQGPWTPADVVTIRRWAGETLRRSEAGKHACDGRDGFWGQWDDTRPVAVPETPIGTPSHDWRRYPPVLCGKLERAVLSGKRELTPAEVRRLVRAVVVFRGLLLQGPAQLAPWLVRHLPESEISRRIRADTIRRMRLLASKFDALAAGRPDRYMNDAGELVEHADDVGGASDR